MRMSASALGRELGMSAKDVNALLLERGYLYGTPGAYGLTEKGQQYGQETDYQRGTGGWASMNPSWTTRSWAMDILGELERDATLSRPADSDPDERDDLGDDVVGFEDFEIEGDSPSPPLWLVALALAGIGLACAPQVRRWVRETAQPGATKLWRKATGGQAPQGNEAEQTATYPIPPNGDQDLQRLEQPKGS